jgi:small membrane protein
MTFNLIQIVLLAVILLMALHAISQRRRREIGLVQLVAWLAVWLGGAVVVVFPDLSTRLAARFGVGRGADLVIYVAIPILFYAVFRLLIRTERLNREITELTRALALEVQRREEGPGPRPDAP